MKELNFDLGLKEMAVNGGRVVRFNPSDVGFLETLYGMIAKMESIGTELEKKRAKTNDLAALFDCSKSCDRKMRDAIDSVFGEGFCADVFPGVRLTAMANGLTVLENFAYAIIDEMDEDIKDNLAKRNDRIAKYTAKYQSHKNKTDNVVPVE